MKFIQKLLATVFAVLLMVTVITPNYFGLAKAEEVPTVVVYANGVDTEGKPVYKSSSSTYSAIRTATNGSFGATYYWSKDSNDKVATTGLVSPKTLIVGDYDIFVRTNTGTTRNPNYVFNKVAVLKVLPPVELKLSNGTLSRDAEDDPSTLRDKIVGLVSPVVINDQDGNYSFTSVEFLSFTHSIITGGGSEYVALDGKYSNELASGHYFGTDSTSNPSWKVGHKDTVRLTYSADGLPDITATAEIEIGEYSEFGCVSVNITGNGTVKVVSADGNENEYTKDADGTYHVRAGSSVMIVPSAGKNNVLKSVECASFDDNKVITVDKGALYPVNVVFEEIGITASDVELSKAYEFAGLDEINEKIEESANVQFSGVTAEDYELDRVEFDSFTLDLGRNRKYTYAKDIKSVTQYDENGIGDILKNMPIIGNIVGKVENVPIATIPNVMKGAHYFGAEDVTLKEGIQIQDLLKLDDEEATLGDLMNIPTEWVPDSTEKVHLVYKLKDGADGSLPKELTTDITVTIVPDGRVPLPFTVDDVTVQYVEGDDFVLDAVLEKINVDPELEDVVANAIENGRFKLGKGEERLSAGRHEVTLTYATRPSDYYGSASYKVNVLVTRAIGKIDAKSEKFEYSGTPAELRVNITTPVNGSKEIEDSIVKIVVGVDGEASGFASVFLPKSLTTQLPESIYEFLTAQFRQGVTLGGLKNTITDAKNMLKGASNFIPNLDAVISALELIEKMPTVDLNAKIYLDKAPVDVGAYAFVAVSTAPNYNISVDIADVIITPSRNAVLNWNNELPEKHVFSYEDLMNDFGGFDFGAHVHLNKSEEETKDHVNTIFAGLDTNLRPMVEVNSADKITMPGIYTETAATIGGNYFANPISRVFIVSREKTETVAYDKTVKYNGVAQSIDYDVTCTSGSHGDLEATVIYTRNGLPVTNPIYAGTYRAYVYFPGDATHEPSYDYATLTIEQVKVGINFDANNAVYDGNQHGATNVVAVVENKDNEWVEDGDITSKLTITYTSALGTPFYYSSKAPTEAGTYYVTVKYDGDRNHTEARAIRKFVIEKAEVEISAEDVEVYYDGEGHAANVSVTCNGHELCESVEKLVVENTKYTDPNNNNTFTEPTGLPVDAGTYEVEIRYPGDRNHKAVRPVSTKVVILPAEVEVTLNSTTTVYGEEPVLTYTAEVAEGMGKYDVEKLNVTPFVIKKDQSVTVNGVNCTVSPVDTYPNVGTYQIWASRVNDKNVNVTMYAKLADGTVVVTDSTDLLNKMATLEITPKKVTVVIDDQAKKTGEKDPVFTWDLADGSSMAYDEDASELGVELSREAGENAGTYAITGTASNSNYFVTFVNGKLTIRKPAAPHVDYVVPNTASK